MYFALFKNFCTVGSFSTPTPSERYFFPPSINFSLKRTGASGQTLTERPQKEKKRDVRPNPTEESNRHFACNIASGKTTVSLSLKMIPLKTEL